MSLGALTDMGDSQLEISLLRSCLALPKVSYVLRACPPNHIRRSTAAFDKAIREALVSILGGPLSDWSWLKACLPSSRDGLNLRSASLHAPAAFLASCVAAAPLVERMLGHSVGSSLRTGSAVMALASAAAHPEWHCLDDIDVPLLQRSLSLSIDEASFQHLLSTAPSIRCRALALSSSSNVLLPNWSSGRPAALDVHVISPLQQQTIVEAAHTPGHALQIGVRRKLSAHLSACRSTGTDFIPLVAKTLVGLAEDTIQTVAAIGRAIANCSGSPDPSLTSKHLFDRLAIALWRGNACLWLHRHPSLPPSLDGVV